MGRTWDEHQTNFVKQVRPSLPLWVYTSVQCSTQIGTIKRYVQPGISNKDNVLVSNQNRNVINCVS
jgi:hypothetical protein